MRGEFIGVWLETWQEIWVPLVVEPLGEVEEAVQQISSVSYIENLLSR